MSGIGRTPSILAPTGGASGDSVRTDSGVQSVAQSPDSLINTPAVSYEAPESPHEVRSGCVIGLDGGGTKVNAAVADLDGKVLGGGTAGSCNIAAMTAPDAFASARAACLAALVSAGQLPEDVVAINAGVAGASFTERRDEFAALLRDLFHGAAVSVEADYAIALSGATGGLPGIVVIAGTGSVAYGEDGHGRGFKSGAYGHMIDDSGSGYGVGREGLAAVMKAADGTGAVTKLTERVLAALELPDIASIVPGIYGGTVNRVKIAALSTVVSEIALAENDEVAKTILSRAGSALAQLVAAVAHELFPNTHEAFPVVMSGSLWKAGPSLTEVFVHSVRRAAPAAVLAPAKESALHGAVRRALALTR